MTTMVCFTSGGFSYCVPVEATRAVRTAAGIVALPGAGPDVVGMIPGEPPLTVVSVLGGSNQILVLEIGATTFGLLVDEVRGLRRVGAADIRPAPAGQHRAFISGTIDMDGELMLVADPLALSAQL